MTYTDKLVYLQKAKKMLIGFILVTISILAISIVGYEDAKAYERANEAFWSEYERGEVSE
jgi:cell division protein FtsL